MSSNGIIQSNPKEPATMYKKPNAPWVKLGTGLFEINQNNYIIISDYFSRYPVIRLLRSTTGKAITKSIFSMFGVPQEIVSDNGPQYQREYNKFCDKWNILHTTSPRHPKSNRTSNKIYETRREEID